MDKDERLNAEDSNNKLADEAEARPDTGAGPTDSSGLREYFSSLLLIIGFSLIGVYVAFWIHNVVVDPRAIGLELEGEKELELIWRILASAVNEQYLYVILGIILCLLAIHLAGRASWYRAAPFLVFFDSQQLSQLCQLFYFGIDIFTGAETNGAWDKSAILQ